MHVSPPSPVHLQPFLSFCSFPVAHKWYRFCCLTRKIPMLLQPGSFFSSLHCHGFPSLSHCRLLVSGHQQWCSGQISWHFIIFAASLRAAFDSVDLFELTRFQGLPPLSSPLLPLSQALLMHPYYWHPSPLSCLANRGPLY